MKKINVNMKGNAKGWLSRALALILCCVMLTPMMVSFTGCTANEAPGPSAPTESTNGTEVGATESTGTTEATEPSGTEGTETIETDPTEATEIEGIAPTEGEMDSTNPSEDTTSTVSPHSHSYSSTVTKEATCTTKGVKTYTCTCGDSYTEDIDKLDHKYTSKTVKATCTTKGYTVYTCACGQSYKDEETKATGHNWGAWTDAGEGKATRKCKTCGVQETKTESGSSNNTAGSGGTKIDPNGDPNGNPANYVAPANPKTGISWDGVSPIIYTYTDGTTGTEPKLGATFYVMPNLIGTVDALTLGQVSAEDYFGGGASDGTCPYCGKAGGDGTNGTCKHWLVDGTHTCEHCGEAVPGKTCHTCDE